MAGNTSSSFALLVGIGAALLAAHLLAPVSVSADGPQDDRAKLDGKKPVTTVDTHVESRPDGVYIQITVHQTVPSAEHASLPDPAVSQPGSGGQPASSVTPGSAASQGRSWTDDDGIHYETPDGHVITLQLLPNIKNGIADGWLGQISQRPGEFPYLLVTDGQFQGVIWIAAGSPANIHFGLPPATPPAAAAPLAGNNGTVDPYTIALEVLGQVPLPAIQVRSNPDLGLVALPGWFWIDGYDGQPFGASRTVTIPPPPGGRCPCPTITVSVRVWANQYQWSFGDGATLVTHSLGHRYPQESDIQHTYEYSSLAYPQGFPVDITVEFAAAYSVDGGGPQPLPSIIHVYDRNYRVQEIQTVLTSR